MDMQKLGEFGSSVKVYAGSAATAGGGLWAWLGENHQQIGALVGLIALLYTTIVFVQNQLERSERIRDTDESR